jgi:hypothetical protein
MLSSGTGMHTSGCPEEGVGIRVSLLEPSASIAEDINITVGELHERPGTYEP